MKTGIIVAVAFWTAVAAGGFWGWLGFCVLAAVAAYIIDRMTERNTEMNATRYTLAELANIDIDLWVTAMGELADRHGEEIEGFKDDRENCPAEYESEFVRFVEDRGIRFDEHGHIANDHRITWCLNWGEDAISGWSACYCVSPDQERERRELRDGTSDVLYRLHLHYKTGKGWYLAFGIDYLPNHERVTQWHDSVADCWREMLTLGVSETTMKRIEYDICGENTYADRAPRMLEYFGELCRAQAENPDEPKI